MKKCKVCEMNFRGEPINSFNDPSTCFLCSTGSWAEMLGMRG